MCVEVMSPPVGEVCVCGGDVPACRRGVCVCVEVVSPPVGEVCVCGGGVPTCRRGVCVWRWCPRL